MFWRWLDPPMCPRARQIIPSLLRRINELEAQVSVLEQDRGNGSRFSFCKILFAIVVVVVFLCIILGDKNNVE